MSKTSLTPVCVATALMLQTAVVANDKAAQGQISPYAASASRMVEANAKMIEAQAKFIEARANWADKMVEVQKKYIEAAIQHQAWKAKVMENHLKYIETRFGGRKLNVISRTELVRLRQELLDSKRYRAEAVSMSFGTLGDRMVPGVLTHPAVAPSLLCLQRFCLLGNGADTVQTQVTATVQQLSDVLRTRRNLFTVDDYVKAQTFVQKLANDLNSDSKPTVDHLASIGLD